MSVYRKSASTNVESMVGEIERMLSAYYGLIDDCEDCPEWKRKIVLDLGGTVSYLTLTIDDTSREQLIETSEIFLRFDAEKQTYFK